MKTIKHKRRPPAPPPPDPGLVYLDDERTAPEGWTRVYTAQEAIQRIEGGKVRVISLDHDLGETGPHAQTGYDVILWLEARVHSDPLFVVPQVHVHTANPVGRRKMLAGLASIRRKIAERNPAQAGALVALAGMLRV